MLLCYWNNYQIWKEIVFQRGDLLISIKWERGASKSFFKGGAASKGMEEFLEAGVGTFKETMVLSSIQQFKNILSATF